MTDNSTDNGRLAAQRQAASPLSMATCSWHRTHGLAFYEMAIDYHYCYDYRYRLAAISSHRSL